MKASLLHPRNLFYKLGFEIWYELPQQGKAHSVWRLKCTYSFSHVLDEVSHIENFRLQARMQQHCCTAKSTARCFGRVYTVLWELYCSLFYTFKFSQRLEPPVFSCNLEIKHEPTNPVQQLNPANRHSPCQSSIRYFLIIVLITTSVNKHNNPKQIFGPDGVKGCAIKHPHKKHEELKVLHYSKLKSFLSIISF